MWEYQQQYSAQSKLYYQIKNDSIFCAVKKKKKILNVIQPIYGIIK